MAGPGVVYRDLQPIHGRPGLAEEDTLETDVPHVLTEDPTDSHALAMADHEEKGAAQTTGTAEITDLGWNEPESEIPKPLVGGLPNEELWVLIRRFNKQMYHVKEYKGAAPGNLDLNIAEEEEFSPDKLRSNVERLYMTIVIGMLGFFKQIVRLRSWRETRRTAWFCTVYFLAWFFDFLVPLFSLTLMVLVVYPPSREYLFPPAPISLVDGKSGGVQKPKAGVLGSHDSATGAPENHKGEAVEQEASNFVNGIASIALSSATGKHPQSEPEAEEESPHDVVPDPTALAGGAADAKEKAAGGTPAPSHDKTKVPMETALWTKMRPIMHGIAEVTDTWERMANALSPTPPFPKDTHRLRLASLILPLFLASLFITTYMFMKGVTFGIGFGFFGDPVIQRGLSWLDRRFPHWQKILELRNTILRGIPTNAQLTITLLRIGEANKAPLPPPPSLAVAPPDAPVEVSEKHLRATGADYPLNATKEELDEAMALDPSVPHETSGEDIDAAKASNHGKKGMKILGFFRGTAKATVNTAISADSVKAKVGSKQAKDRLGVVPRRAAERLSGPVVFKSRFHGRKGHIYISHMSTPAVAEVESTKYGGGIVGPRIAFTTSSYSELEKMSEVELDALEPEWSIPLHDITELKKIGGFGWKAKLVVGWALEREVDDGLEIVTGGALESIGGRNVAKEKDKGVWKVTAMPLRDELFNRLVSMGGQRWECW